MSDYEVDYDERCPKCNHSPIHRRRCEVIGCDDGYIDLYHEDPLFFDRGDTEVCPGCQGTGIERWCPGCGADLSDGAKEREEAEAYARAEAVAE